MKVKGFFGWWITNPVVSNLAMLFLVLAGVLSYLVDVEKEVVPPMKWVGLNVNIPWPGADPRDVEQQLLIPIEQAIREVNGIKEIKAKAWPSWGGFNITGRSNVDREVFIEDIKQRINSLNGLPSGIEKPRYREWEYRDQIIKVALHGDSVDEFQLNQLAREVKLEISQLPYISSTGLYGQIGEQVIIEVAPQKLLQYQISLDEVSNAIRRSSFSQSVGKIANDTESFRLTVLNKADDKATFEQLIIRQTDGVILRLKDVATVTDSLEVTKRFNAFDGEQAILIEIYNATDMDILAMSEQVNNYVEKKLPKLPKGFKLTIWEDKSISFYSRVKVIFSNAMFGILLVFVLLFLFLQTQVALWVAAGIFTAFAASFALMPYFDISLNMISIFSFMLVIGIVVDDAIVIGESIHNASESGLSGQNAAYHGLMAVAKPVAFGVVTTIVAALPIAFISGSYASSAQAISVVLLLVLVFSLFEAFCILPAHLRALKKTPNSGKLAALRRKFTDGLSITIHRFYKPFMKKLINQRYITVLGFILLLLIADKLLTANFIKQSFSPKAEADIVRVSITMPSNTPETRVQQVFEQVMQGQADLTDYVASLTENGDGQFIAHSFSSFNYNSIRIEFSLVPYEQRAISIKDAMNKLKDLVGEVPDAEELSFQSTFNESSPSLNYSFFGNDLAEVTKATQEFKDYLSQFSKIRTIRDSLSRGSKEIELKFKPGAEALGIPLSEISRQVRLAFDDNRVQTLARESGATHVILRYPAAQRASFSALNNFMIRTRDNKLIPLANLVDINFIEAITSIFRFDGKRRVWIKAEYIGDDLKAVRDKIKQEYIPQWRINNPNVEFRNRGGDRDRDQFINESVKNGALAFVFVYILLSVAFGSYSKPLLILSSIPFAYAGAIYGHLLHDTAFGLFSWLGIIATTGVVINDNLVFVDYLTKLRNKGIDAKQAVIETGIQRFRAIILTSLTTFFGLAPMLYLDAGQSQFLVPMVVSLAYGVLFCTFVTLVFTPCLYLIGVDIKRTASKFNKG